MEFELQNLFWDLHLFRVSDPTFRVSRERNRKPQMGEGI